METRVHNWTVQLCKKKRKVLIYIPVLLMGFDSICNVVPEIVLT